MAGLGAAWHGAAWHGKPRLRRGVVMLGEARFGMARHGEDHQMAREAQKGSEVNEDGTGQPRWCVTCGHRAGSHAVAPGTWTGRPPPGVTCTECGGPCGWLKDAMTLVLAGSQARKRVVRLEAACWFTAVTLLITIAMTVTLFFRFRIMAVEVNALNAEVAQLQQYDGKQIMAYHGGVGEMGHASRALDVAELITRYGAG